MEKHQETLTQLMAQISKPKTSGCYGCGSTDHYRRDETRVLVSCPLGTDYQESPSRESGQPATPRREQDLPDGITLEDFSGTPAEKQGALRIFTAYSDVFAKEGEDLGHTTTAQHSIPTTDDVPVAQRHRRIPPNQLAEVKQHLQDLLEKGVITPSQSNYASPIVLVRKKNGTLRMCVDYRPTQFQGKTRCLPTPQDR